MNELKSWSKIRYFCSISENGKLTPGSWLSAFSSYWSRKTFFAICGSNSRWGLNNTMDQASAIKPHSLYLGHRSSFKIQLCSFKLLTFYFLNCLDSTVIQHIYGLCVYVMARFVTS